VAETLQGSDVIYTDFRTAADLVYFRTGRLLDSDVNTIPWENVKENQLPNGAYVLVHRQSIDFLRSASQYEPPRFANAAPPGWKRIKTFVNADLYLVNGN